METLFKRMCEKARRIFKTSENAWLWFDILKFTNKLNLPLGFFYFIFLLVFILFALSVGLSPRLR